MITIKDIRESNNIHILSDKTGNLYSLVIHIYNNFIKKELHSKYKRVADAELKQIYKDLYGWIDKLKLKDRIEPYNLRTPHFTLKDHKEKFVPTLTIRLIYPSKSDIGIISKAIIYKIIPKVKASEKFLFVDLHRRRCQMVVFYSS